MKKFKLISLVALMALVIIGACKKKDQYDNLSISFSKEKFELTEGNSVNLRNYLEIAPESLLDEDDFIIEWMSGDNEKVVVSKDGRATAVFEGETVITASAKGKSATCKVVVKSIPITAFTIPEILRTAANVRTVIDVTILPKEASSVHLSWKSTEPEVMPQFDAESKSWYIETSYVGDVTLTASYGDLPSKECEIKITAKPEQPLTDFELSWSTFPQKTMGLESSVFVYAYDFEPADGNYTDIKFAVDKPELATLSAPYYNVLTKSFGCNLQSKSAAGDVVITATEPYLGISKQIYLTIEKKNIQKVEMLQSGAVLKPGEKEYLGQSEIGCVVTPADASKGEITFSVKNENNVEVGEDILKYYKSSGSWYVSAGNSAPTGRYTVEAIVNGVKSEPMYVYVIDKQWVADNIDIMTDGAFRVDKLENGYEVNMYGCLGIRQHLSLEYLIKDFDLLDETLKKAFILTYEGNLKDEEGRGKSFYFLEDYGNNTDLTFENKKRMTFDYAFFKTVSSDKISERINPIYNTFDMKLYVKTGSGMFNIPLKFKVYTSFYSFFYRFVGIDRVEEKDAHTLDYNGDCFIVDHQWSGSYHSGTLYQKGVNMYVSFSISGTYGRIGQYKCWSAPVKEDYISSDYENAYIFDSNLYEDSKLPANVKSMHCTIRWCAASGGCEGCKYQE